MRKRIGALRRHDGRRAGHDALTRQDHRARASRRRDGARARAFFHHSADIPIANLGKPPMVRRP